VPVDAGRDEGNGAGHVADRRPQSRHRPQDAGPGGRFLVSGQQLHRDLAQLVERRSPKPGLLGVRDPRSLLSGTLRGESACTLRTQKWETSVRPKRRTYSGPAPPRSAAARTGILGMTAKERARPASVAVAGSIPAVSTQRDMAQLGRALGPGPRSRGFKSLYPDSWVFSSVGTSAWLKPRRPLVRSQQDPPCRTSTTASVPAFQADDAGSIPACGSRRREHEWLCS
jgi:hypothetical protein